MDTETRHFSAKRHPRLPAVVWIAACRRTAETTWLLGNWRVTRLSFRFPRLLIPGTLLRRVEVESPDLVSPQSGWTLLPRLRNLLAVRRSRSRSPQANIDMTYQHSLTVCRVNAALWKGRPCSCLVQYTRSLLVSCRYHNAPRRRYT